jgi:hypothetical protein
MVVIQQHSPKNYLSKNGAMNEARQKGLEKGFKRSQQYLREQKDSIKLLLPSIPEDTINDSGFAKLPKELVSKIVDENDDIRLLMRSTCRLMNDHIEVPELTIAREFCDGKRVWLDFYSEVLVAKKEFLAKGMFEEKDLESKQTFYEKLAEMDGDSIDMIVLLLKEDIDNNNKDYMPAIKLATIMDDADSLKELLTENALDHMEIIITPKERYEYHQGLLLLAMKNNSKKTFEVLAKKNLFGCKNISFQKYQDIDTFQYNCNLDYWYDCNDGNPRMLDVIAQDDKYKDHDQFLDILKKYRYMFCKDIIRPYEEKQGQIEPKFKPKVETNDSYCVIL